MYCILCGTAESSTVVCICPQQRSERISAAIKGSVIFSMNVDDIIDIARNYLGAECFDKVVLEHVLDEICIKKIISKLLGYAL